MRLASIVASSFLLLSVAACSTTATGEKAMGAGSTAPTAASQMPQSPNSLPQGASVNAPVTSNIGKVGTTAY